MGWAALLHAIVPQGNTEVQKIVLYKGTYYIGSVSTQCAAIKQSFSLYDGNMSFSSTYLITDFNVQHLKEKNLS